MPTSHERFREDLQTTEVAEKRCDELKQVEKAQKKKHKKNV
jgi:hypothetical protein